MNIEKMSDEELTLMLAVDVMGWELSNRPAEPRCWVQDGECLRDVGDFNPLTDANDTLMLIDAMLALGWNCAQHHFRPSHIGKKHDAHFLREHHHVFAVADTGLRAVCLAAAKAICSINQVSQNEGAEK